MKAPLIVLAFLMATGSMLAQPMDRNGQGLRENRPDGSMMDRLELSEAQKEKIDALRIAHHKATQPLENQLGEKRAALRTLTMIDTPDRKKIEGTVAEIGKLENTLMLARINHQLDVRALLDDKQKVIFDDRHEKMAKGGHGGMHQRH